MRDLAWFSIIVVTVLWATMTIMGDEYDRMALHRNLRNDRHRDLFLGE